jgi:DGQHR domain-containing protein
MSKVTELRIPAIEVSQGKTHRLYSFAIDGKKLPSFSTVSRIKRDSEGDLIGYQRPEVVSHISEIRQYLESEEPMIPNALVIAFDDRVRFEPSGRDQEVYTKIGHLVVPIDLTLADEDKPGWVVDGQQRLAAIRDADIESFPICVVSFIARDYVEQREQFILVNSTKPLPKGLIYELLPSTQTLLPTLLQKRRFPSLLLSRLNADDDSPLKGMIKTPTSPGGIIKDNSILKMLEHSLSDGALYRHRRALDGEPDIEQMLILLKHFWGAVAELFEEAWGESPRKSRLMHGAGIVSLGFLMDAIADRYRDETPSRDEFLDDLKPIQSICRWTDGYWDFGPGMQRKWNEIQNTHKDIQLLANHLLVQYKATVWSKPKSQPGR